MGKDNISVDIPAKDNDICIGNDRGGSVNTVKLCHVWMNDIYGIRYHHSQNSPQVDISQR